MAPSDDVSAGDDDFFRGLPEVSDFADVTDLARYSAAPRSWLMVLTDVRGSTRAIEAGRYRDVNALGVSSIIALCNAMPDLDLPYMFGGDGATLLVPGSRMSVAQRALRGVRKLAHDAFNLSLRAGIVPLAELAAEGHDARVARYRVSEHTRLAMFSGSAFAAAEKWVKDPERGARYEVQDDGEHEASFEGFECRWQPLPSTRGVMASLLVTALAPSEAERVRTYRDVLAEIERIARAETARPAGEENLRFAGVLSDYSTEARVRSGQASGPGFDAARALARKKTQIGRALTFLGKSAGGFDGRRYRDQLIRNTDFRKFDETLRMVLDLSSAELTALRSMLERERDARRIAFGIHEAPSALMTCLVRSYEGNHVHFVDGSGGGYALAAKQLKAQLASEG